MIVQDERMALVYSRRLQHGLLRGRELVLHL
jgi:hypothetical protein